MADAPRVAAVVVTYDALPWIEQCLDSLRGVETVVVDNGSSDGTAAFVRERFPEVKVVEAENRGLGAGWNIGVRETSSTYVLLLNADAWLVDGALERLCDFADTRPRAAVVGPRLLNPDGTLQRSVRGYPTRLAPRDRVPLPAQARTGLVCAERVLRGRLRPRRGARGRGRHGRVHAPAARGDREVGECDEDYFLFSEETDWCYRFREAGWEVVFFPGAECVHVRGASHSGRLYRENLRGHLLFLWKHRGAKEAERARRLLLASLRLRGLVFRGERGRAYRDGAAWLASGDAAALLGR